MAAVAKNTQFTLDAAEDVTIQVFAGATVEVLLVSESFVGTVKVQRELVPAADKWVEVATATDDGLTYTKTGLGVIANYRVIVTAFTSGSLEGIVNVS